VRGTLLEKLSRSNGWKRSDVRTLKPVNLSRTASLQPIARQEANATTLKLTVLGRGVESKSTWQAGGLPAKNVDKMRFSKGVSATTVNRVQEPKPMNRFLALLFLSAALTFPTFAQHHGGGHHSTSTRSRSSSHAGKKSHHSKIHRSAAAKDQFLRESGYPHGRKGYVVDHKIPLACGGADSPSNMQWQTKADAKAKDKWERNGCR